ncbi:hypothetical protein [Ancylobacter mangrovi]|uniref:hypothetical protein n=1 Tax=Ancylobacter mangrovi TaxID=2972472 RepID=UPI00216158A5|nr:hypothetical protein [Ancylobacter mangrovi]MCS0501736.1 hypothetical protein [Ancylobacter mangrovi]
MVSTSSRQLLRRLLLVALVGCTALTVAGCESLDKLNPFAEKEKKLPGTRVPVFPEGVPGVDYNAAPPQPANSAYGLAPDPSTAPPAGAQGTAPAASPPPE